MVAILSSGLKNKMCFLIYLLFFLTGSAFIVHPAKAALEYGQAYPDIGTFSNSWGNWSFWIGWDGNFSETYLPEGESYAWVIYFAPEAVYLALQSSKSVYSGVNVNAGYKYFYGVLNLATATRLSATTLSNDLSSIGLSQNLFSASTPGIGFGPLSISNLSFALSSGLTFLKEKSSDTLKRGVQIDSGLSVSYDLISNPLPFSVSLGTDCVADDPPELCQFHGFYPIIIWEIEQQTSQNPIDMVIAKLQENTGGSPSTVSDVTQRALLEAVQIMRANTGLVEFLESVSHDSAYDTAISETQQWLQTGDTGNLPLNVNFQDPVAAQATMKPIYATTQMAFELGYLLGCRANPDCTSVWDDCVVTEYCTKGQECVIEISAEELVQFAPGTTVDDFEDSWLLIDNPVEQYLVSETATEEWIHVIDGKATYKFRQNTDTPVFLGLRIDPSWSPVTQWVHPCSRLVLFEDPPPPPKAALYPGILFLLLD